MDSKQGDIKEVLLPIHRKFTDKEKIAVLRQQVKSLEKKLDAMTINRNLLEKQVFELKMKLKDEYIPDTFGGSKVVSAKAYSKLTKQCKMWQDRFWEIWNELEKTKQINT